MRKFKANRKIATECLSEYVNVTEEMLSMTLTWDGAYLTGSINDWKVFCTKEMLQEYLDLDVIFEI